MKMLSNIDTGCRLIIVARQVSFFTVILPIIFAFNIAESQSADNYTRKQIVAWLEEGASRFSLAADASEVIEFYGKKQLGIEYAGGLLDVEPEEKLVVTLDGSDCVIYVETSFALALTTLQGSTSWDQFRDNLKLLRYRDGRVDGYNSRLHYFSDWMKTNQEKGLFNILHQDTELPTVNRVLFMSANRGAYPRLAESDSLFNLIAMRETELQGYNLYYIPTDKIHEYEKNWKTGDLLGFVSTIEGLDIAHTALIKRDGNRVGFYHASTAGEVMEDSKTVYEYSRDRRNVNGVVVARPVFTRDED